MKVDRVIVVAPGFGGADGASELARQWVEALRPVAIASRARLEVWSLTDATRPAELPSEAEFRGAAGSRWRFAAMALVAGRVNRGTLVVAMHVHLLPALVPLLLRQARIMTVLLGIEVWKPLRPLERLALRRSWRIAAISAYTAGRFKQENAALADLDIAVCHPSVPAPVVPAASAPEPPYALIVGRMSAAERYKGHDLLIDIWPRVLAQVPHATLVIAGGGDDVARLQQQVGTAGLAERIRFVGAVPTAQLSALYRHATFFVMPSRGEGFGIVFLEAMRVGRPCIAGPGAAEEIITNGEDGVIVDPARPEEVAAAVTRLFLDAPFRERLGVGAATCVASRFGPQHLASRVSQLIGAPC